MPKPNYKTPLISIVTACYNTTPFISDLLKSVLAQDYSNWEMIIVDDFSTDNSVKIIEDKVKELGIGDRVTLLRQNRNRGYGYTLWNAIKHSKGQLVAIVDADDALHGHQALSISVKTHRKYPDVALTYSNYMNCNANLEPCELYKTRQIATNEKYIDTKIRVNHLKVFKRIYYDATEGVNRKLRRTVDKDLVLKLEEVGELKHIELPLYLYRKHNSNISRGKKAKDTSEEAATDRRQIYSDARTRRRDSLQSTTWLKAEKCKHLQLKWGDYDAFAECPSHSNKQEILDTLRDTIDHVGDNASALDVGCGAGHFMWAIKDKVSKLIGLDYSPAMLVLVEEQFFNNGIIPELVPGSCWSLPFEDNDVDIAYQVDVCMHVGGSWESIKEMIRVAKRYVVFTGPSFDPDLIHCMDINISGKRWAVSISLLIKELDQLKAEGIIKDYKFKKRKPTDVYKHKILVVEK